MDRIDRAILRELQAAGRLSIVELASRVHLSKTPCAERVRKLEAAGVIRGYHAALDAEALGQGHVTLVQVQLRGTTASELEAFNAAVREVPQIQSCHMTAGGFDYLLKVRTSDINAYREVLGERISSLPHVASTSSFVAMETIVEAGHNP